MDYKSLYPWAPQNLLEETSCTSSSRIVTLRKNDCPFGRENDRIHVVPCREDEPICCDESSNPGKPLFFFYVTVFKKVSLRLPLTYFEKELLTELNIAPIVGHLSEHLLFFVRSSALRRLWRFSYTFF